MFDPQTYAALRRNVEEVAAARADTGLATGAQVCDALRDAQKSLDVLDGVRADLLSRLEATAGHADEGAPTVGAWARRQLRMGAGEAGRNTRAGQTLRLLPAVAQALADGRIRAAHVYEFTSGVTKLGASVMVDLEEIPLPVAETGGPGEVREMISQLHQVLHPDDLDDKYARGMERKDLKATKCGEGYHVSGFLDILAGAKFSAWLKDVSAPEYDGDDRTPAQRRVDAFCRVFEQALTLIDDNTSQTQTSQTQTGQTQTGQGEKAGQAGNAGQDASTGQNESTEHEASSEQAGADGEATSTQPQPEPEPERQPQAQGRRRSDTRLLVLADLETLLRMPGARPATLAGFGPIGQQLLGYLTCGADTAGILTHGYTDGPVPQADVLNVGRKHRLATGRQRDAILARQDGECAAPGCQSTYLEIHHVAWWDRDHGRTDLDNLIGICSKCHYLVHQQKLTIRPDGADGFTFHRSTGKVIDDHARDTMRRTRQLIADIGRTAATGQAPRTRSTRGTSDVDPGTAKPGSMNDSPPTASNSPNCDGQSWALTHPTHLTEHASPTARPPRVYRHVLAAQVPGPCGRHVGATARSGATYHPQAGLRVIAKCVRWRFVTCPSYRRSIRSARQLSSRSRDFSGRALCPE